MSTSVRPVLARAGRGGDGARTGWGAGTARRYPSPVEEVPCRATSAVLSVVTWLPRSSCGRPATSARAVSRRWPFSAARGRRVPVVGRPVSPRPPPTTPDPARAGSALGARDALPRLRGLQHEDLQRRAVVDHRPLPRLRGRAPPGTGPDLGRPLRGRPARRAPAVLARCRSHGCTPRGRSRRRQVRLKQGPGRARRSKGARAAAIRPTAGVDTASAQPICSGGSDEPRARPRRRDRAGRERERGDDR